MGADGFGGTPADESGRRASVSVATPSEEEEEEEEEDDDDDGDAP